MSERDEPLLYPELPVIDCHHHLFGEAGLLAEHLKLYRFLVDDYAKTVASGHRVVASVAVEARAMFRADGPEHLKVVGETEFINGQAAMAASGTYGPCRVAAGIVGYADLSQGAGVRTLLEAHVAAAPVRFKGIRQEGVWDADRQVHGGIFDVPEHLYADPLFHEGFAQLAPLGLSFDAFVLAPQLADVISLARSFPDTSIILNHVGSPVGICGYRGRAHELFPQWRSDMAAIAACPNTTVKLGGLGSFILGSAFYRSDPPADMATLVAEWQPYVEVAIELFGADRCMFESNQPTDGSGSFRTVCNAYKQMTAGCTHEERAAIFAGTGARVYRLGEVSSLAVGSAA